MKVRCKKCNHYWNYKGKSKYYATCPNCYNKVRLIKDEKKQTIK